MIEELPDDIDNDELDDVEPVGDEAQLYEHFRVVVDKGQEMVRVDKYLFVKRSNRYLSTRTISCPLSTTTRKCS